LFSKTSRKTDTLLWCIELNRLANHGNLFYRRLCPDDVRLAPNNLGISKNSLASPERSSGAGVQQKCRNGQVGSNFADFDDLHRGICMAARGFQFTREARPLANLRLPIRFQRLVRNLTAAGIALSFPAVTFGQLNLGQSSFGQSGFGQTSFGQTGQTGTGQTGTGQTGLGQGVSETLNGGLGGAGLPGFGANPFSTGGLSGEALSPYGRNGLIGNTASGGTAAGGTSAGGALGAASNLGGLTGAALNNRSLQSTLGGLGGRGGRSTFSQNQNSDKPKIRTTVKLGFQVASPTNEAASRAINERLNRLPSRVLNGVTVSMSGRTAIIQGEVSSPSDGKVIERLLSLEPGIDAVKNELTYTNLPVPPAPSPTSKSTIGGSQRNASRTASPMSNAGISTVQIAQEEVVPAPDPM
jgi:hypothetical protein